MIYEMLSNSNYKICKPWLDSVERIFSVEWSNEIWYSEIDLKLFDDIAEMNSYCNCKPNIRDPEHQEIQFLFYISKFLWA